MKIAVIGVGGSGSAALWHLARRGHDVTGFEQFSLGHDRGSSHGESRVIRYTYVDGLYTELMADAHPLWGTLEAEVEEELFVRCGGLMMAPEGHPDLVSITDALSFVGQPYELLGPEAVAERFPALRLKPGERAIFQKESGFLRAGRCVLAYTRAARDHGATIFENTPVTDVSQRGTDVLVTLSSGEVKRFDRVIVTAGPYLTQLFSSLSLKLVVSRQEFVYFAIRENPAHFNPKNMPIWIDSRTNWYGFPSDGVIDGVKLAEHVVGEATMPNSVRPALDEATHIAAWEEARERLPGLENTVTFAKTCLYTNTTSEDFILDFVPGAPGVFLVSGCSGHGFKFTTLLGEIAARRVLDEPYPRDISRFALARFR